MAKSTDAVLNPYIYKFSTLENVYTYLPTKQRLISFSLDEWNRIEKLEVSAEQRDALLKNKVYTNSNFKRNFLNFYRTRYISSPKLKVVYVIPTDACNFACSYCFIENNFGTPERNIADFEYVKKWLEYAINKSGKQLRFIFYGGEALLNTDLIIKSIGFIVDARNKDPQKAIRTVINTNGSIYTSQLSNLFRRSGTTLVISVDGPREIHDKCRLTKTGNPSFDLVAGNIDKYIRDGVKVSLSITITRHNVGFLPQIAKWVVDNYSGRIGGVGFNPPMEAVTGNKEGVDDFRLVMLQLYNAFRILKKHGIYEDRTMRRIKNIISGKPRTKDCAAIGNQIVVSPDGQIGPCQAFMGSKEYFKHADPKNYEFGEDPVIKEWSVISPLNKGDCRDCPFILLCGNACPYISKIKEGSLTARDKRYCTMLPIMMNEVLKDNFYKDPKALFVDYDNTIILRKWSLSYRLDKVREKFNLKYERISQNDFYKNRNGVFNVRDFLTLNGVEKDRLNEIMAFYSELFYDGSEPNFALLKQLEKIKLPKFILTNTKEKKIVDELKRFKISSLFDGMYGNDKFSKPSRDFYLHAFSSTGFNPEDVVYIGDSLIDILPIYAFGVRAVLVTPDIINNTFENDWLVDLCKKQTSQK